MPEPPANQRRVDRDGVVRVERRSTRTGTWIVGLAIAVLCACLALSAWLSLSGSDPGPQPAPTPIASRPSPSNPSEAPPPSRPRPPVTARPPAPPPVGQVTDPMPPPESPPEPPPEVTGGETGIALFHPGIKPIKKGIVVPDDFQLPPGYVRHYQTTDEGQQLAPILMFHPDYKPVDANGQPVPLPESRIVPPELAPPGLPIKMLDVPEGGPESPP